MSLLTQRFSRFASQARSLAALTALITVGLGATLAPPAQAFGLDGGAAPEACRADARKLCQGERPGGGRIVACLQQHEADLSEGCKAKLPEIAACSDQVKQVCGDASKPRELKRCMQAHKSELSACGKAAEG